MPEHHDFDRQFFGVPPKEPEQLEDSDERQVEERQSHVPASSLVCFDESPVERPGRDSRPHPQRPWERDLADASVHVSRGGGRRRPDLSSREAKRAAL